jgi:hypothetical protein
MRFWSHLRERILSDRSIAGSFAPCDPAHSSRSGCGVRLLIVKNAEGAVMKHGRLTIAILGAFLVTTTGALAVQLQARTQTQTLILGNFNTRAECEAALEKVKDNPRYVGLRCV